MFRSVASMGQGPVSRCAFSLVDAQVEGAWVNGAQDTTASIGGAVWRLPPCRPMATVPVRGPATDVLAPGEPLMVVRLTVVDRLGRPAREARLDAWRLPPKSDSARAEATTKTNVAGTVELRTRVCPGSVLAHVRVQIDGGWIAGTIRASDRSHLASADVGPLGSWREAYLAQLCLGPAWRAGDTPASPTLN